MHCKHLLAGLLAGLMLPAVFAANVRYGVMCYHDVIDESTPVVQPLESKEFTGEIKRRYFPQTITVERLTAHFNWLRDNGYTPVSFKQIEDARAGRGKLPAKPVLLTFDDGYISFYTKIYPLLKAFNYPAVFALVTSWMETPQGGQIAYGKQRLPRSAFITWEQVREMQKSGLVEIASHTHDLHRSVNGNPSGSQFAAVFPEYKNGRYETPEAYKQRIRSDLKRSADIIAARTGVRPSVIVWPYGQFNETARAIAAEAGLVNDFTLFDDTLNTTAQQSIGRALIDTETGFPLIKTYLDGQMFTPPHQRAVYIDLGMLHSTDPKQFDSNFDKLVSRIYKMGITTVYLQAFADDDGNGKAEAVYFPNRHIKMKADLFSRVAWQLITRSNVKVYAWLPMTAFDADNLSQDAVADIYQDLAFSSRFNGLLFNDNGRESIGQAEASTSYSNLLKQSALKYSFNGKNEMKTVRSLHAGGQNFAGTLPLFAKTYDYTAVTLPFAAGGVKPGRKEAAKWAAGLIGGIKNSNVPLDKTVFELQTDPLSPESADGRELASWMNLLKKEGVKNLAYKTDDFRHDKPPLKTVKPAFSVQH